MRWGTGVKCPEGCGGELEAFESDARTEERMLYNFVCSNCNLEGFWNAMARTLHPAKPKFTPKYRKKNQ